MADRYPNSGILFQNDRKVHDRSPDLQGEVFVEIDVLKQAIADAEGGLGKLRLAGWRKQGSRGPFVSLSVSKPFTKLTNQAMADDEDVPF